MRMWLACTILLALTACDDDDNGSANGDVADAASDSPGDAVVQDTPANDRATDTVAQDLPPVDLPTERTNTCTAPASAAVANASVPDGFCASIWAEDLSQPRGIEVAGNGDLLVVERGRDQVVVLWDDDGNGLSDEGERAALAEQNGLNHGIAIHGGFLYASSDETVYRWPYEPGQRQDLGTSQIVVNDIPGGGHSTRTLVFDAAGQLYVQVGSGSNVDDDADRAGIRRFTLPGTISQPLAFESGEYFASGMRNEVGVGIDLQGRMWGVENGADELNRDDLGGDIHQDNPAEELNLFEEAGRFYGYPYCWSEFQLAAGDGPGTQWAHERFIDDGTHTDAWCQDTNNVVPPRLAMQGHSAPLDIHFYRGGSFPNDYVNEALVSFHGSWNRDTPTGYKVMHVVFENGNPVRVEPLLEYDGSGDIGQGWPHRPVGVRTGAEGQVYVSSDASGVIIVIGHQGN